MASDNDDILRLAASWQRAGRGVALATVVTTWGSSPRPVGSKLIVDEHSHVAGSVSGGCVEGAVIQAALDVIRVRTPRMLEFGVSDAQGWNVGLSCGGKIRVYVESLS